MYTAEELLAHCDHGDAESGHRGHPQCHLCSKRFYDLDVLAAHQRDDHHLCFVCASRGDDDPPALYSNAQDLHEHFRRAHFLCKICKKLRSVAVFATQEGLDEHHARLHTGQKDTAAGGPRYRV